MSNIVTSHDKLKTLINKNGFNWTLIGQVIRKSPQHVVSVAHGKNKNHTTARAIQVAADIPFVEIFGISEQEYEKQCVSRFSVPADKVESQKAKLAEALGA